jgi:hypothetical protein
MYLKNKRAWCEYAAPRWAEMLKALEGQEKQALWAKASPELKDAIRRLAK